MYAFHPFLYGRTYDLLVSEKCLFANEQKGPVMIVLAVSPLMELKEKE